MSDELLSALMDGQCTAEEVDAALAALEESPALKVRWTRMALTREALAGTRVRKATPDFALDVMAAIDADEARGDTSTPVKVVPLRPVAAPAAKPLRMRRRWQPAVGLAAAASITAAVVLVGGRLLSHPVGAAPAALQAQAEVVPADLVATVASNGADVGETRWTNIDADAARQLNDYLMEHSNSRSEAGMGGSLSYARLAVRTADYRQADGSH